MGAVFRSQSIGEAVEQATHFDGEFAYLVGHILFHVSETASQFELCLKLLD